MVFFAILLLMDFVYRRVHLHVVGYCNKCVTQGGIPEKKPRLISESEASFSFQFWEPKVGCFGTVVHIAFSFVFDKNCPNFN
jgi:hypothetical protein